MPDQQDFVYVIQPRGVDQDDIDQEAAIFEWTTGRRANRRLIANKLQNDEPAAVFSGDPTSVAVPVPTGVNIPNPRVIEQIVTWSLEQSDLIRKAIFEFLEEPTDDNLSNTLTFLIDQGIIEAVATGEKPKKVGFIDALVRLMKTERRPYTSGELYAWARTIHSAKRPEATVRQALRRLISDGKVVKTNDSYQLTEEA